ncbi:hypothetical protein [Sinorhizobium meliloti]|uniref:hypothetical protein n=1 Tax=Rhizobium meliloti TaxID=382 RepID=UPI003F5CEB70
MLDVLPEALYGLRMKFNDVRRRLTCGEFSLEPFALLPQRLKQRRRLVVIYETFRDSLNDPRDTGLSIGKSLLGGATVPACLGFNSATLFAINLDVFVDYGRVSELDAQAI